MSTEQQAVAQQTEAAGVEAGFLDRAISATTQTPVDTTKELLSVLTSQALEGTVTWDKNLTLTIEKAIAALDVKISDQLSTVMKNEAFQKLEGTWLGLQKLVKKTVSWAQTLKSSWLTTPKTSCLSSLKMRLPLTAAACSP